MWSATEASMLNWMDFACHMWLLNVSMQIKSGPMPYLHFCKQDVMCSFYSVSLLWRDKFY